MKTRTETIRIPIYAIISYESNMQLERKLDILRDDLENVEYVIGVGLDDMEVVE